MTIKEIGGQYIEAEFIERLGEAWLLLKVGIREHVETAVLLDPDEAKLLGALICGRYGLADFKEKTAAPAGDDTPPWEEPAGA